MKNIIYFFLLPVLAFGQSPTQTENYVSTKIYKTPTTTTIASPTAAQVSQNVSYLDGSGRLIQQVISQQSSSGKNVIIPVEYDALGRQIKKYLPYTTQTTGLDIESSPFTDVLNYSPYQGQNPYSETLYENSPLSRVIKEAAPGSDWAIGSGHEIKSDYFFNDATGPYAVKLFVATSTWNNTMGVYDITLTQTTNYAAKTLYKTTTKNENWVSGLNNTIDNFIDKNGQVVLRRLHDGSGTVDTYYVYDQFGNLTYVIPPNADASINSSILDKLCYQYKYDYRNRLVEKKLPGQQWDFIIYDRLNRIVATGPAFPPFSNLTQSGWMITKYDVYNRPVITAWMTSASAINSALRKTRQDERDAETVNLSESRTSSTPDVTISGITYRYTNLTLPTSGYHVLTVNYYDDYNFPDAPTIPSTVEGQPVYYNSVIKPKGLMTGGWIRASKTSTSYRSELSYVLYDKRARPIRVFIRNHELGAGGYSQIDSKFNFIGQTDYTVITHKRINSDSGFIVKDFYTYSDQNRLLTHTNQINSGAIQLLCSNTYDELGKLISKDIGNTSGSPLQRVNFSYNIRGWLTAINDITSLSQSGDPLDLFAFKINYNTVENETNYAGTPLYNGNIAETYWRTSNDNVLRKYGYIFDNLNRLKSAVYQKPGNTTPVPNSYDENLTYDKNGNILSLKRNGNADGILPAQVMDDLTYTYEADTNKLLKVSDDPVTATSGFSDGVNTGNDYTYDTNGNLMTDANKGITAIVYNHLNLPIKITFGSAGTFEYLYDAVGNKLEKTVTIGSTVTNTKYLDGFQYVNDVLQFFPTSEGYVAKTGSIYKYVYQYKDHLGNVRLSYAKNSSGNIDIIEESHFYPYGLRHSGYNTTGVPSGNVEAQKYKYNGKELQDELGLNIYDFGARNYDPAIGRWMNIDPLAETSRRISPYVYALNNPIYFVDPDGMDEDVDWGVSEGDGWIERENGSLYYDPNVHGQGDVKNQKETYICEECVHTTQRGMEITLWDRDYDDPRGNSLYGDHLGDRDQIAATVENDVNNDKVVDLQEDVPDEPNDITNAFDDILDDNNPNRKDIEIEIKFEPYTTKIAEGKENLMDLVKALNDRPDVKIEILGNSGKSNPDAVDDLNKKALMDGKEVKEREFRVERAKRVRDFLIENGIDPSRLSIGVGKLVDNPTATIKVIK